MARDYENIDDLDSLPDTELAAVVRDRLSDYDDIDLDNIVIEACDGVVAVRGYVGTEGDFQRIEQILADVIGIETVVNELVVDEIALDRRAERPGQPLRPLDSQPGGASRTSDEAAHLREDEASEQFGTMDMHEAIERGITYEPPDGPMQEGVGSGEQH